MSPEANPAVISAGLPPAMLATREPGVIPGYPALGTKSHTARQKAGMSSTDHRQSAS
jgi:hypothetical protein